MGESRLLYISYIFSFIFIIGVIVLDLVAAADIHGVVYNIVLEQESDVRLEINTLPNQFMISKDGAYNFNVPNGNYTIKAYTADGYAEEDVTVLDDGEYMIDIVLMPVIGQAPDDYADIESIDVSIQDPENNSNYLQILLGLILISIISVILFLLLVRKNTLEKNLEKTLEQQKILSIKKIADAQDMFTNEIIDANKQKALDFIKHNERITQKDLRKQLPLSEAKISLIVAELEHDGKIKKIKKGRGNILVYVK